MSLVVNTNMTNETTQRLLDEVSRNQARSIERLTSGVRINSARDNASGLSVVTNMTQQIQGLSIATRGANDGINMVQTADSALSDTTDLLQRMRELGIQSMNSSYSSAQRGDMDAEFQQLNADISRIASASKFNGQTLLKGTAFDLQVGWTPEPTNKIYMSGFLLNSVLADVKTIANASQAVIAISNRLQSVQTQRAKWGAVVNRVEYAISGMNRLDTNIKSSRSQLLDVDYAKETADLTRAQISQQAGAAMMAQSNQSSKNVLSLLR